MSITDTTEKRFESDIEAALLAGGYQRGADPYDPELALYTDTLISFIQATQPKEWARFQQQNEVNPVRKFCMAFNAACDSAGLLSVLRHGFKHKGITFRVCCFRPESGLNETSSRMWKTPNSSGCTTGTPGSIASSLTGVSWASSAWITPRSG